MSAEAVDQHGSRCESGVATGTARGTGIYGRSKFGLLASFMGDVSYPHSTTARAHGVSEYSPEREPASCLLIPRAAVELGFLQATEVLLRQEAHEVDAHANGAPEDPVFAAIAFTLGSESGILLMGTSHSKAARLGAICVCAEDTHDLVHGTAVLQEMANVACCRMLHACGAGEGPFEVKPPVVHPHGSEMWLTVAFSGEALGFVVDGAPFLVLAVG